jgi:hypothetical protein
MKGLHAIPSETELMLAYARLQGDESVPIAPAELALWSQWSRFDPRLAEQCVESIGRAWKRIPPVELHELLVRQPWPAAFGVWVEHITVFKPVPLADRALFQTWADCVMAGIQPAEYEQFFIGLRALGGPAMRADATLALEPYLRWGYLGREILINKFVMEPQGKTLVPARARRAALDELIRARRRLTLRDYRDALGGWVSSRQAEYDLAAHPRLLARGRTKARIYWVKRRGAK